MMPRLNLFAQLALLSILVALPATAQLKEATSISPEQARQTLETLQDDELRGEVVRTLGVIASEVVEESDPPAEPVAEEESPLPVLVPLEEGGLVARTLDQVEKWLAGLRAQLLRIGEALAAFPAWFQAVFLTAEGRLLLWQALANLSIVFGVGLCLEWLLRRMLRRSARSLVFSARQAESRRSTPAAALHDDITDPVALAALRPLEDSTALVQTERDGLEYVEAVPVGSYSSVGGLNIAGGSGDDSPADLAPASTPMEAMPTPMPVEAQMRALRRLPFALTSFILDLLPLGLFFAIAALVLQLLPGLEARTHLITREFIYAYVITRVVMAVVRLLLSPGDANLRVVQLSDTAVEHIHRSIQRLVVLATFGVALGHALGLLGSGPEVELVVIKATSLLVHLSLLLLIFRYRHPVGRWIAGSEEGRGTVHALRHWLAGVWPLLAGALVMGVWVVWALSIEDGFTRLLEFTGISAAIIVLGRLAAVVVLGALGRIAGVDEDGEAAPTRDTTFRHQLVARYYPLLRWLVSTAITAVTLLALLEAWGLEALHWFAPGTIGGSFAAALATILVAVFMALVVWQAATAAMEKRVTRWRKEGDLVRAARLNTLLPMLRSALFLAIALIIGLTTLSQIGISIAPLLAGAGILGVALGFGSQKLVQDFINGIFLLMENAMQVGDSVTVAGIAGTVENLSIRTMRLRASDGSLHIIPFSAVTTVNNRHRGIGNAAIRVSVTYDSDINLAISELRTIGAELRQDPVFAANILADMEVWGVDAMDGSMITLAGQIRCVDKARAGVQREINRRIVERFRAKGITMADPRERPLVASGGTDGQ